MAFLFPISTYKPGPATPTMIHLSLHLRGTALLQTITTLNPYFGLDGHQGVWQILRRAVLFCEESASDESTSESPGTCYRPTEESHFSRV